MIRGCFPVTYMVHTQNPTIFDSLAAALAFVAVTVKYRFSKCCNAVTDTMLIV